MARDHDDRKRMRSRQSQPYSVATRSNSDGGGENAVDGSRSYENVYNYEMNNIAVTIREYMKNFFIAKLKDDPNCVKCSILETALAPMCGVSDDAKWYAKILILLFSHFRCENATFFRDFENFEMNLESAAGLNNFPIDFVRRTQGQISSATPPPSTMAAIIRLMMPEWTDDEKRDHVDSVPYVLWKNITKPWRCFIRVIVQFIIEHHEHKHDLHCNLKVVDILAKKNHYPSSTPKIVVDDSDKSSVRLRVTSMKALGRDVARELGSIDGVDVTTVSERTTIVDIASRLVIEWTVVDDEIPLSSSSTD